MDSATGGCFEQQAVRGLCYAVLNRQLPAAPLDIGHGMKGGVRMHGGPSLCPAPELPRVPRAV